MREFTIARMDKCSNLKCMNGQMLESTDARIDKCSKLQMHVWTNAQNYKITNYMCHGGRDSLDPKMPKEEHRCSTQMMNSKAVVAVVKCPTERNSLGPETHDWKTTWSRLAR